MSLADPGSTAMDLQGPLPTHLTSQFTVFTRCVIAIVEDLSGVSPHPTLLEDLSAGVLDFGGAYRHSLDDMASITHIVPLSGSLDEKSQRLIAAQSRHVPVVYWQWIMDCINCRRYLSPRMYIISLPLIPKSLPPPLASANDSVPHGTWYSIKDLIPLTIPIFTNRTLYLHSDVPTTQATRLTELISNNGGRVTRDWPDGNSCEQCADMFVFRYAQSTQFLEAVQLKLPVASLHWLFDVIRLQDWTDPLDSLLHYPFPHRRPGSIPHAALCLTEFQGRNREYCKELMHVLGAKYHSDMNRETTHLIAAKPSGKKYSVATSEAWKRVHTVNYTWLEDSVMHGQLRDTQSPIYRFFVDQAPCVSGSVVGTSRTPQWVIDRIVAEARGYVERVQAKRQRELESLMEAAGVDAPRADGNGDEVVERRAKERGLEQVHRQYSVLQNMSKEERRQVEKTWEMGDGEFEAPEDEEATQVQVGLGQSTVAADSSMLVESSGPRPKRSKRTRDDSTSPSRRARKLSTQPPAAQTKERLATDAFMRDASPAAPPLPHSISASSSTTASGRSKPSGPLPLADRHLPPTAQAAPRYLPPHQHQHLARNPLPPRSVIASPRVMVSRIVIPDDLSNALQFAGIPIANANAPIVGATHLVTNNATYAERFLLGMATAKFIVHSKWLTDSAAAGYPVDEGQYLLDDPAFEAEMHRPVVDAMRQIQSSDMLSGKGLCVVPNVEKSALSADMARRLAHALRATHVPLSDLDTLSTNNERRLPVVLVVEPKEDDLFAHYPRVYDLIIQEMECVEQGQPNRGLWMYGLDYFTWSIRSGNGFQTPSDRVVFWAVQDAA